MCHQGRVLLLSLIHIFHTQRAVFVVSIQIRSDTDILDTFLIAGIQLAVASHSAITEEILIFKICTVAPAEHLKSYQVLPVSYTHLDVYKRQ